MTGYRLYFRARNAFIVGRHDFVADDDTDAIVIAEALFDACSDECSSFELWQSTRQIDPLLSSPERAQIALGDWTEGRQAAVIEHAELLQRSPWLVARSQRLPQRLDELRMARQGPDLVRRLERIVASAVDSTGAHMGNIQVLEFAKQSLRIAASVGFGREFLDFFATVDDERGAACGAALKSIKRVIVEDVPSSPIFGGTPALRVMSQALCRSCHSTPLVLEGRLVGMLNTHRRVPWTPPASELERIDRYAKEAASVIAAAI